MQFDTHVFCWIAAVSNNSSAVSVQCSLCSMQSLCSWLEQAEVGRTQQMRCVIAPLSNSWIDTVACLHWLHVPERMEFKIAVLTYKVVHKLAPGYLGPFTRVTNLPSRRSLRSVGTNCLVVPTSRLSTVGSQAFPVRLGMTSWKTSHQQNHWPHFVA